MSTSTKRPKHSHAVIEGDGIYGDVEACVGHLILSVTDPRGATINVEVSHDDGVTWHPHHTILPSEFEAGKWRKANRHHADYIRHYSIREPMRMRIRVEHFRKPFKYWLEHRI